MTRWRSEASLSAPSEHPAAEKTAPPQSRLTPPATTAEVRADRATPPAHDGNPSIQAATPGGEAVAVYGFGARCPANPHILVLKLDHLGDFIIGTPALRRLRAAFPEARIHLVVGSWNRAQAEASGVADSVATYDYFPQHAMGWDGQPHEPLAAFRAATPGRYDVAIDLRVDEDTRPLLREVDAALRCGLGPAARHPFLDIALPPEHPLRDSASAAGAGFAASGALMGPERFKSRMPFQHAFHHETDFRPVEGHLVYGPYVALPAGRFTAAFSLRLTGWALGQARVTVDVARDGAGIGVSKRLRSADLRRGAPDPSLAFTNDSPDARHEFRVHVSGHPRLARLRFGGVHLRQAGAPAPARLRPAALHTGEQLSLLVQLVIDRTQALYQPPPQSGAPGPAKRVAVAPFSNSDLRDWPSAHYVQLIKLLVERLGCTVTLLGSRQQAGALGRMAGAAGGGRVRSLAGQTAWADLPALLRGSDLVICNNSGIAHLAAASGALTLALYAASHQPQEWGPRGQRAHAMMAVVPCSPCGYDRLEECPNDHRCMRGLAPEAVFAQACALLSGATALAAAPLGTMP